MFARGAAKEVLGIRNLLVQEGVETSNRFNVRSQIGTVIFRCSKHFVLYAGEEGGAMVVERKASLCGSESGGQAFGVESVDRAQIKLAVLAALTWARRTSGGVHHLIRLVRRVGCQPCFSASWSIARQHSAQ